MNNELYQKVRDKYGMSAQLDVAIEELSELIKEVCKNKRGHTNAIALAEEIADVEIMCEQLRFLFDFDSLVDEWKTFKLERLEDRINQE